MPSYSSLETGEVYFKLLRFVVKIPSGDSTVEAVHVYEVQYATYPGADNEILYSGGYRRINIADQQPIQLNELKAKTPKDAIDEIAEQIKKNHSYEYQPY